MKKTILGSLLVAAASVSMGAVVWTEGHCASTDWTPLSGNVLLGVTGTTTADGVPGYASGNAAVLTDGSVPTNSPDKAGIFGFRNSENVSWTFATPKTIDQIRISTCYFGGAAYDGVHVAKIEAKFDGDSTLTEIAGDRRYNGESTAGNINYLVLENGADPVAQGVVELKVTFGACETGFANYYCEIEAVSGAGAQYPTLGAIDVTPGTNTATISGTIIDIGADATACNVYLALNGGAATEIATGVTNSFEHQLTGLAEATEYAYVLCISNNAPTAMGAERSGSFTTFSATLPTVGWTTGHCAPADWRPLSGNVLLGVTGTTTADGVPGYASGNAAVLTDGSVPTATPDKSGLFGFRANEAISWTFSTPETLEKIRISTCYLGGTLYDGVHVSKIEVKFDGDSTLTEIAGDGQYNGESTAGNINYLVLENGAGPVAQGVVELKVTFGTCENGFANYYCEIEAVSGAGALYPTLGVVNVDPGATSATVSGTIIDVGAGATACDVYLALNGGTASRIAAGVTSTFEFPLTGLAEATEYAYVLCVSNNAAAAKGAERSGSFTTLHAAPPTASWTQGECNTADWSPLNRNILAGLTAANMTKTSYLASSDSTVLTDGEVPDSPATDGEAGAVTVGFAPGGTIEWKFEKGMTLVRLRLTSFWRSTDYNGISVNAVEVKYKGAEDWTELYVPTVVWTGGTLLCQTETLSDPKTRHLAKNVVGLKITFGTQKNAIANYYAEIEAVGRATEDFTTLILR